MIRKMLCKIFFFLTLHQHFPNYDYRSSNHQFFILFKKLWVPAWNVGKIWKFEYFPTLLSHFSNYDYWSANLWCNTLSLIICENFSLPLLMVKKWWPSKCSKHRSLGRVGKRGTELEKLTKTKFLGCNRLLFTKIKS